MALSTEGSRTISSDVGKKSETMIDLNQIFSLHSRDMREDSEKMSVDVVQTAKHFVIAPNSPVGTRALNFNRSGYLRAAFPLHSLGLSRLTQLYMLFSCDEAIPHGQSERFIVKIAVLAYGIQNRSFLGSGFPGDYGIAALRGREKGKETKTGQERKAGRKDEEGGQEQLGVGGQQCSGIGNAPARIDVCLRDSRFAAPIGQRGRKRPVRDISTAISTVQCEIISADCVTALPGGLISSDHARDQKQLATAKCNRVAFTLLKLRKGSIECGRARRGVMAVRHTCPTCEALMGKSEPIKDLNAEMNGLDGIKEAWQPEHKSY
ncbi:hypothetical protein ACLOJK_035556 [Asimina triloba]